MNGILIIDKPKGYTSRDVVNVISKKLNTKKVGHTGTLDPLATGVLVLCLGKSLKLSELLVSTEKEYIATVKLGIETDTLDITGTVKKQKNINNITNEDIKKVLNNFKGHIKQQVPKYSAVKVNGKKLYQYARENKDINLPIREVEIKEIELLNNLNNNQFSFRCIVSKGTYIRSLVRDIGHELNTYATMTDLRRTKQGNFLVEESYTIENILNNNYKIINPIDVLKLPKIIVNSDIEKKIRNGQVLKKFFNYDMAMILNSNKELLAIYKTKDKDYVKPYKMLV